MKTTFAILCAPLALAACGPEAPAPEPSETPPAAAAIDAPADVSLTDAEVRMPAVTGRPGVAYFTIASEIPRMIVSASVLGAGRSEMHETKMVDGASTMAAVESIALMPGEPVSFQPGGYHVMLFDMDATIAPGGTADLTVTFKNGDKASISAPVVPAGGMSGDMAGHDMEGMH